MYDTKIDVVKRDVYAAAAYSKSANPQKKTDVSKVEFELASAKDVYGVHNLQMPTY